MEKLKNNGVITDESQWVFGDWITNALAVVAVDKISGGTWTSDKTNSSIHWAQPSVISLASKDGGDVEGTKIIEDPDGMIAKLDSWASKGTVLALIDKATGGTNLKYKNRATDHWARNCLDSLADKGAVTDVAYWTSDFDATIGKGVFMILLCNAFGL